MCRSLEMLAKYRLDAVLKGRRRCARREECHRLEAARAVAEATRALDARGAYPSQEAVSFDLRYNAFDIKGTSRVAHQTYRTTMTAWGLPLRGGEACRGE